MPKTLIPPPPDNPSKAPIENVLELTSLKIIDKDLFTNTRPLWHPPGARGIYGGAAIAQSLAAAQLTIPPPSPANNNSKFYVHSMHCYFVLAGNADIPVIYSVERVRDGKSFMTRTVQARQEGRCIFTTTLSFARVNSGGHECVEHAAELPRGVVQGLEKIERAEREAKAQGENGLGDRRSHEKDARKESGAARAEGGGGPFEHRRIALTNGKSASDSESVGDVISLWSPSRAGLVVERSGKRRKSEYLRRNWGRRGEVIPASPGASRAGEWTLEDPDAAGELFSGLSAGGMEDKFWKRDPVETIASSLRPETKRTHQWVRARGRITSVGQEAHLSALAYMSDSWFIGTVARVNNLWRFSSPKALIKDSEDEDPSSTTTANAGKNVPTQDKDLAALEDVENNEVPGPPRRVGMMVSLDHTIYFHRPEAIRADEWLFQEMESPWAGDGRGLVIQKVWNRKGELLATCIQEGVVRLEQEKSKSEKGKL